MGTRYAIGAISVKAVPGKRRIVVSGVDCDGRPFRRTRLLEVLPGDFPTERLHVAPSMAEPPSSMKERISRENLLLREIFSKVSDPMISGAFTRPVPGKVVSPFGATRIFNGQVHSRHSGVDFRAACGTPVRSMNSGKVVMVRKLYYTGLTVVVDHGLGLHTLYAHLSRALAKEGEYVSRGAVIALSGASGRVTGPHLHLGLKLHGVTADGLSALALPIPPAADEPAVQMAWNR